MKNKKLIERLEDLAAFFTLAAKDVGQKAMVMKVKGNIRTISFCEGKETAFNIASAKIDAILKEAKK